MPDLPASVYAYLHTHILATRAPAYLLVRQDGRLEDWGGELARYGMAGLQVGIEVERQVHCLAGLLSMEAVPLCLPCVETPSGLFADLHLFPAAAGMWALSCFHRGVKRRTRWSCCKSTTQPSSAGPWSKTWPRTRSASCEVP